MLEENIKLPLKFMVHRPNNLTRDVSIIFLLHGYGSNMADLFLLHQFFPKNFITVSLQAPIFLGSECWAWSNIDFNDINTIINPTDSKKCSDLILDSINHFICDISLNIDQIYLAGFSQGASLALYCGLKNPNKFRGIISLCGYINNNHIMNISDKSFDDLNVLICNSVFDNRIPIELGRSTKDLLKSKRVKLAYNEYDFGHGISNEVLNDMVKWIQNI